MDTTRIIRQVYNIFKYDDISVVLKNDLIFSICIDSTHSQDFDSERWTLRRILLGCLLAIPLLQVNNMEQFTLKSYKFNRHYFC